MRQFFKFVFASCLGIVLFCAATVGILTLVGLSSGGGESAVNIKPNSILELNFDRAIPDLTNNTERDPFDFEQPDILGMQDIIKTIEHAQTDKNIKGILIYPKGGVGGMASMELMRDALKDFKDSGKFVVSYSSMYTQGNYYLAGVSDEVYLHPLGVVDFRGLAATIPFYKGMLEKIGVKLDVFYAGNFKSATEPYRRTNISEPNRLQLRELLQEVHDNMVGKVSESRNIPVEKIEEVMNTLGLKNAEAAKELGFVDDLVYRDQLFEKLRSRLGLEEDEKIKRVNLSDYSSNVDFDKNYGAKEKIAVVTCEGTIVDGKGQDGETGDYKYVKIIEKLRKDDKVKAIVLRVNSPGGSVLSSDNILRELQLTKEAGKKIVVSMGNYAASGGYYISCAADSIFAEPQTITGSIGVFMMFPNVQGLMNDKLGINYDTVATAPYAGGFNPAMGLSETEGQYFQQGVDMIYERFLRIVGNARGMTRDQVHEVAQGRVWTGRKAVEIGLVDKLGNLNDAVTSVAGLAGLENYRVINYPKSTDPMQKLIEEYIGGDKKDDPIIVNAFAKELKGFGLDYEEIKMLKAARTPQYRLPFKIGFE